MQRISLLLAGFAPAALWGQQGAGTELWRVAATTLPLPAALGTGGAAAFWNPAQPAIPERASLALEVIETAPTVGASGVLTTARVRVRPHGDRRSGTHIAQPRPRSRDDCILHADARRDLGHGVGERWDRARRDGRVPANAPRRRAVEPLDARCGRAPHLFGCRDARPRHALLLAVRNGGRVAGVVRRARGAGMARPALGDPGGGAGPVRHRHGARLRGGSSIRGRLRARPPIRLRSRGGA